MSSLDSSNFGLNGEGLALPLSQPQSVTYFIPALPTDQFDLDVSRDGFFDPAKGTNDGVFNHAVFRTCVDCDVRCEVPELDAPSAPTV